MKSPENECDKENKFNFLNLKNELRYNEIKDNLN